MAAQYHMIGYIHEGADALQRTLNANEEAVLAIAARVREGGIRRVVVSGLGSSHTAAMMAAPMLRYYSAVPVHVLPSTEIALYADRLVDAHTLVVVVSRSGERNWVVDALKDAVARGALGVAMTGVADSLLVQHGQIVLLTGEGPEITFPKTKSVIACAGLLMRLALALAAPDDSGAAARLAALRAAPEAIRRSVAAAEPQMQALMPFIESHHTLLVCGTGSNFGVALEAAVKVQEAAYVTTLCDDTGNMLHGPLGPLNADWLVMPLVTAYDLTLSRELMGLVRRLGGHIMSITGPDLDVQSMPDRSLVLPDEMDPLMSALVYLPPIQMLAYYWTVAKGMNPDAPAFMEAMLEAILPPDREEPELRKE